MNHEYTTDFLATFAFPTLFPDGKGDPKNPCLQRYISFGNIIQHLLKYAEKVHGKWVYRFASHPRFSYWALNMIQRKRALQQNSIFLQQNPDESHLTFEQLQEMACSNSSTSFTSKLSRYVANVTGSSAYWFKVKEDLKAIIVAKGAPTIFFTFSSSDLYWPELHSLFSSNVESLSMEEKRKNVIDNPHLVDWFFTRRLESFLKHWLYETLDAEWHWYRYEFQARGSIHCHGTAKLKSDPGFCKLTDIALKGFLAEKCQNGCDNSSLSKEISDGKKASKIICEYVNRLITTWNPCPPQNEMWSKPHVHSCSRQHEDIDDSQQTDD